MGWRSRTRARSCIDGEPVDILGPDRRHRSRDQHGPPALHAGPGPDRRREHPPRRGDDGEPRSSSTGTRRSQRIMALGRAVRLRDRPRGQDRARCPSAGSSGSRSSRRSTARRASSSSTSRPPSSLPRRPRRSSPSCAGSRRRGTASSSSATSSTRSSRSPTGSRSSGAAGSSASGSRRRRTRTTWPR